MSNKDDLLSPEVSPQKLQAPGVKRVNNVPLILIVTVLTLFALLIALAAQKRARAQLQTAEPATVKTTKKSTLSLANELVGRYKPGMLETKPKLKDNSEEKELAKQPSIVNHMTSQSMVPQAMPDEAIEQLRQQKMQAFEEAVKAKTAIQVENSQVTNSRSEQALLPRQASSVDVDMAASFNQQLQLLQTRQGKTTPQTLGGKESSKRWQLHSSLESPNSPFELRAGSVIPGVMISGISSELPGQIIAQVSQDVYDTATGKHLLFPQGTKLFGVYSSNISFGQNGVLVAWQRMVFPDAKALDIGSMPGADSAGYSGFRDQVNHHYARIYGSALLMSAIVAGVTYSQGINQSNQLGNTQPTAGSVLSEALGQQLGAVTSQLMSKNLNVSPTINIRPGYRFNIIVTKDLTFNRPYQQFAY